MDHDVNKVLHDIGMSPSANVFPDGHQFQMDNDPKHCSHYTRNILEKEVNTLNVGNHYSGSK